jgi:hypothetical protein
MRPAPSEDPYAVEQGAFYRRWLSLIWDVDELPAAVESLPGRTDDQCAWSMTAFRSPATTADRPRADGHPPHRHEWTLAAFGWLAEKLAL